MSAWNGWYHCTGSTYGTWVRGNPRGWRERNHREHVDGDYKNPPPAGTYDRLYRQSKQLMTRERVLLTPEQREFACRALVDMRLELAVEVIPLCVGAKHWHALLRFRNAKVHRGQNRDARLLIGKAKGKTARLMSKSGIDPKGGIWAQNCRLRPVKDREHQLNIAKYIPAHARKGAAVILLTTRGKFVATPAKPGASAPRPLSSTRPR